MNDKVIEIATSIDKALDPGGQYADRLRTVAKEIPGRSELIIELLVIANRLEEEAEKPGLPL